MQFRTKIPPIPSPFYLRHTDSLVFAGSCFSVNIGQKCKEHYLNSCINPFGTIFHPMAIFQILERAVLKHAFQAQDLIHSQHQQLCLEAHSSLTQETPEQTLELLNQRLLEAHQSLKEAKVLFLTFGTALAYTYLPTDQLVANCHKIPSSYFTKSYSTVEQMHTAFESFYSALKSVNPTIEMVCSVSPVRHTKEGMLQNSRSKALLVEACHQLTERFKAVHYFPSYELFLDDLRDYRFYTEDLIHPNQQGIQYIWEYFTQTFFDANMQEFLKEAQELHTLVRHKIMHPGSPEALAFENHKKKAIQQFNLNYGRSV